jgi:hypothetical protein
MFDGNSRGSFGGLQSVQTLGIINALKTGDPTLDTFVAMLLPLLLGFLVSQARRHSTAVWAFLMRRSFSGNMYMRTISYRTSQVNNGMNMNMDDDSHNRYLIKCIKLYVHAKCQLKFDEAELELTEAVGLGGDNDEDDGEANMAMMHNKNRLMGGRAAANTSVYSMLRSCQVVKKPIQQQWHDVDTFGGAMVRIWVKDTINDNGGGGGESSGAGGAKSTRNLEIRLESNGPTSIDEFVNAAYTWYMREMKNWRTTTAISMT